MEDAEKLARNFFMPIEDAFEITEGGTVVTGQIIYGVVHIGDTISIHNSDDVFESVVTGIEMFRHLLDRAEFGDNVGLLLKGIELEDIEKGAYLTRADEDQTDIFVVRCPQCNHWVAGKLADTIAKRIGRTLIKNSGKVVGAISPVPGGTAIGGIVDSAVKEDLNQLADNCCGANVKFECAHCAFEWESSKEVANEEAEISVDEIEYFQSEDFNEDEITYLNTVKECLEEDNEISSRERRLLDKLRMKLGISEERAKELEATLSTSQLTEEEQEYLEEYRACLEEGDEISPKERRLLDKLRVSLGISEDRAKEIENL